jgi:hypothetical protein
MKILFFLLLFFSGYVHSQTFEKNGSTFLFNGAQYKFGKNAIDTFEIFDPISGKKSVLTKKGNPEILEINGNKVYKNMNIKCDNLKTFEQYTYEFLKKNIKITDLTSGVYSIHICNIIIDTNGKIVYFEYHGINYTDDGGLVRTVNDFGVDLAPQLIKNAPELISCTHEKQRVYSFLPEMIFPYAIRIKGGDVQLTKNPSTPHLHRVSPE